MVRRVIDSALFHERRNVPDGFLEAFLIRGGGAQVDDSLKKHGWNGVGPITTSVLTFDALSGAVRGHRYETRGTLPDVRFMARDLWPEARARVAVNIRISNLSTLNWMKVGEYGNFTT